MKTALFLIMMSVAALAADSADEKAVRESVAKFNAAAVKGDEATLKALVGDGLVYTHSNAKLENKAECIAALVKTKPNFEMKPNWTVQVYGKSAVVHGHMTAHGMTDGKPTETKLDLLMVWVKAGKGWSLVARHTAKLPV